MKPKDIPGMAATPTLHAIVYLMKCRSQTCTHFRQEMNDKERRKNALRIARRQRKKKITAPGIPKRSPIQVLTGPYVA